MSKTTDYVIETMNKDVQSKIDTLIEKIRKQHQQQGSPIMSQVVQQRLLVQIQTIKLNNK